MHLDISELFVTFQLLRPFTSSLLFERFYMISCRKHKEISTVRCDRTDAIFRIKTPQEYLQYEKKTE